MGLNTLLLMSEIFGNAGYTQKGLFLTEEFCEDIWSISILNGTRRMQCSIVDGPDINSYNNTRTCGGGESFLGVDKELSITTFVYSLLAVGVTEGGDLGNGMVEDSEGLYEYYQEKVLMANSTSCYECDPTECMSDKSEWCLELYGLDDDEITSTFLPTFNPCLIIPCGNEKGETSTTLFEESSSNSIVINVHIFLIFWIAIS